MDERIIFFTKREPEIMMQNDFSNTKLKDLPLTMSYAPMQKYDKTYEDMEALERGTLYPNLDKPFLGKRMR